MITRGKNSEKDWIENFNPNIYKVPEGKGKDAVWQSIFEKIEENTKTRDVHVWKWVMNAAALFVGLLTIGSLVWILVFGRTEYYCRPGEHQLVELPDGSGVNMNADTRLGFNKYFWNFSRSVNLEGEALFTVKRGKSFSVITGLITTQVLGTTFNVYARNSDVRVSCIEGKVAVIHNLTKQKVVLSPSQKTSLEKNTLNKPNAVAKTELATWTKGEFYFVNEDLNEVFREIERQFNVSIKKTSETRRFYTGVFFKQSLTEALDLVCVPMQLEWKKTEDSVIITEKK